MFIKLDTRHLAGAQAKEMSDVIINLNKIISLSRSEPVNGKRTFLLLMDEVAPLKLTRKGYEKILEYIDD